MERRGRRSSDFASSILLAGLVLSFEISRPCCILGERNQGTGGYMLAFIGHQCGDGTLFPSSLHEPIADARLRTRVPVIPSWIRDGFESMSLQPILPTLHPPTI
ncbi:hypothetical protein BJY00DRAFT_284732 [Aspergillus carlsbadensis]|nr:hypothetical protein BJY00DRAFT_284732 [Aspergillus carlsbadensis]